MTPTPSLSRSTTKVPWSAGIESSWVEVEEVGNWTPTRQMTRSQILLFPKYALLTLIIGSSQEVWVPSDDTCSQHWLQYNDVRMNGR